MRQNPTSWKGCVRGAARSGAGHTYMGNFGNSRANTCTKTRSLGMVVFAAPRGAGHSYMGNRGHSRANTFAKTRQFGRVVFAARRGAERVILTRVTGVILELIHAPKPYFLEGLCSRRGMRGSYLHG